MKYTESEIIDEMILYRNFNENKLYFYLDVLPNWRAHVFKRHIKYVICFINNNGNLNFISRELDMKLDELRNIYKKIETCLHLAYKNSEDDLPEYNSNIRYTIYNFNNYNMDNIIGKDPYRGEKLMDLVNNDPDWGLKIKDPKKKTIIKLLLDGKDKSIISKLVKISDIDNFLIEDDIIFRELEKK